MTIKLKDPTGAVVAASTDTLADIRRSLGINDAGGSGGAVSSVAGKVGAVTLVKGDVGLTNVDNTADASKPVSSAQTAAIAAAAAAVTFYPTSVAYSTTIPLNGNKYSADHTVTGAEAFVSGSMVEGGSYNVRLIAGTGAVAPTFPNSNLILMPNSSTFNTIVGSINLLNVICQGGVGYAVLRDTSTSIAVAPTVLSAPVISSSSVGVSTSYTAGTYSGNPTPTITRQWTINGVDVSGATNATYTPISGDAGKALRVRETATNTAGSVSSTSAPVTVGSVGVTRTDNFNRANSGTLGTPSDAGSAWVLSGPPVAGIVSNKAFFAEGASNADRGFATLTCAQATSSAQVTITMDQRFFDNSPGITFGKVDDNNFYQLYIKSDGVLHLGKRVAGTFTDLGTYTIPSFSTTGTYTIAATLSGAGALTASIEGSTVISGVTDTSVTGGTKAGLTIVSWVGSQTTSNLFEDFSAT